jgi:hypothetical protein
MASAVDIQGQAFVNGSVTAMARLVGSDGELVAQADIASISYTIYTWDKYEGTRTAVEDHEDEALSPVSAYVFDTLQDDGIWTVDETGYNFRHVLDVSAHPAFAAVGTYLIEYQLTPVAGQVIIVRFAVTVI